MGNCTSTTSTVDRDPDTTWNPRLYHGNDSYLQRYVAVSRPFYDRMVAMIEDEGCNAARFPSPTLFNYNRTQILHAIRGTPFSILYKHIADLGLTPQVFLEPRGDSGDHHWVCSIGALEDLDWISILLGDTEKFRRICTLCDITIRNFGRMMVIGPKLFKYSDRGSMSSTMGQYGSITNLRIARGSKDHHRRPLGNIPSNVPLRNREKEDSITSHPDEKYPD